MKLTMHKSEVIYLTVYCDEDGAPRPKPHLAGDPWVEWCRIEMEEDVELNPI